jgi:hypothetical protein
VERDPHATANRRFRPFGPSVSNPSRLPTSSAFIQSAPIVFSSFTAKLTVSSFQQSHWCPISPWEAPAINPASEAVKLQIGTLAAMSASILATACKISFHRRSSSAAGKMEDAADQGGLRFFASRGDEPIGWINSIVLSTGMGDLIAGPLQGEFQLPRSGP